MALSSQEVGRECRSQLYDNSTIHSNLIRRWRIGRSYLFLDFSRYQMPRWGRRLDMMKSIQLSVHPDYWSVKTFHFRACYAWTNRWSLSLLSGLGHIFKDITTLSGTSSSTFGADSRHLEAVYRLLLALDTVYSCLFGPGIFDLRHETPNFFSRGRAGPLPTLCRIASREFPSRYGYSFQIRVWLMLGRRSTMIQWMSLLSLKGQKSFNVHFPCSLQALPHKVISNCMGCFGTICTL